MTEASMTSPVSQEAQRLAEALGKLSQVQEPSELVYGSTPIPTQEPPEGATEDYSITVARRISTVLGRLSTLADENRQRVLTPRGVLVELMDIVQHGLFLALPAEMRHVGRERQSKASAYHTYVSSRCIPVESMMEGLHTITYVSVKLRLELVTLKLQRRLREELDTIEQTTKDAGAYNSEASSDLKVLQEEQAALLVTETLLQDFVEAFNNALLLTPVISNAAAAALRSPVDTAIATSSLTPATSQLALQGPGALSGLLPTLERYYYQIADWVMLTASAADVAPITFTRITKVHLDVKKGTVECELHRPNTASPWGLLFNERGRLIGVDTSMRIGQKAKELHNYLRCSQDGVRVSAVNDVLIRHPHAKKPAPEGQGHESAETAAGSAPKSIYSSRAVFGAVQAASVNRKRIKLTLKSANFKANALHTPAELIFSCPPQGGEGASGQRAALLLHRLDPHAPWQFAVNSDLMWFPPPPRLLSASAQALVRSFPYRLRVFAVNGVEVTSPVQLRDLVERVEVMLLELVVVPPHMAAGHTALPRAQPPQEAQGRKKARRVREGAVPVEQAAAPPRIRVETVDPGDVAAIEEQVRAATQRLMLTHAQQGDGAAGDLPEAAVPEEAAVPGDEIAAGEEYEMIDVADADADAEIEEAVAEEVEDGLDVVDAGPEEVGPTEAVTEELDSAADRILRDMLRKAGVDTGDQDARPTQTIRSSTAESGKRKSKSRKGKQATNLIDDSAATADAPCLFENDVQLLSFDGTNMEFRRPSTELPWGIKIAHHAAKDAMNDAGEHLPLRVLALPQPLPASARHPFLSQFNKAKNAWLIDGVNGKSAAVDPKKVFDVMRGATKMSLKLFKF